MKAKLQSIELSSDSSVPMYQKLKNAITENIHSGEWQTGEKIPSENQLASDLSISRMTINRSLRELAAKGLLRRVHGMGTFVAEPPRQASLIELRSIDDEIAEQGKLYRAEVHALEKINASGITADRMGVREGDSLFHLVVVHFQDDVPIQHESRYVNPAIVPEFIHIDFTLSTSTNYLIGQIRPDELEHVVQATLADEFIATQLRIPLSEPCLRLKRRTWVKGTIVTAVDMIYPSSRYDLGARYFPASTA